MYLEKEDGTEKHIIIHLKPTVSQKAVRQLSQDNCLIQMLKVYEHDINFMLTLSLPFELGLVNSLTD